MQQRYVRDAAFRTFYRRHISTGLIQSSPTSLFAPVLQFRQLWRRNLAARVCSDNFAMPYTHTECTGFDTVFSSTRYEHRRLNVPRTADDDITIVATVYFTPAAIRGSRYRRFQFSARCVFNNHGTFARLQHT